MSNQMLEIRTLPVDMYASDGENLKVQGYVNMTGSVSEILTNPETGEKFRETILPHVFSMALQQAPRVDFLYQHDKMAVLSTTENDSLSLSEDTQGLFMRAKISDTSWGRDTYQLIKDGIIRGMSFGMIVDSFSWKLSDDGLPLRVIESIRLFEVSAVRNPAYRSSTIETRGIEQLVNIDIPKNIEKREEDMTEPKDETKKDEVIPKEKEVKDEATKKDEATPTPKKEDKPVEKRDDDVADDPEDPEIRDDNSLQASVTELIKQVKALLASKPVEKRDDEVIDEEPEERAKEAPKDEKPEDKAKTPAKETKETPKDEEKDTKDTKKEDGKDGKKFPFEKRELVEFFDLEKREV